MAGRFLASLLLTVGLTSTSFGCSQELLTLPANGRSLHIWLVAQLENNTHAIGVGPYILRRHRDIAAKFKNMGLKVSRYLGGGELKTINLLPYAAHGSVLATTPTSNFLRGLRTTKDKMAPDDASHILASGILSQLLGGGNHFPFYPDSPHLEMRLNPFVAAVSDSLTHELLNSINYLLEPLQYFYTEQKGNYPEVSAVRSALLASTPPSKHPNIELVSILISLLENDGVHKPWFATLTKHIEGVKRAPLTHAEYKQMYDLGYFLADEVAIASTRDADDIFIAVVE